MLHALISISGILITIFFVIGTHEYAHFITARLLGVKILCFSIGFGKSLLKWHDKHGTEYILALVPLGGYVKMLDESEGEVPAHEIQYAYNRQPFYKKFLIVLAGPAMNLICAVILYWLVFVLGFTTVKPVIGNIAPHSIAADAGLKANQEIVSVDNKTTSAWQSIMFRFITHAGNQDYINVEVRNINNKKTETHALDITNWHMDGLAPDPFATLGITPYEPVSPLVLGNIGPDSPAAKSSLRLGDKIIAVNQHKIKDWEDLIQTITSHPSELMTFTIERQGKIADIPVNIGYQRSLLFQKSGYLGIGPHFQWPPDLLHQVHYGPIEAIPHAYQEVADLSYFNILLFGKMLTGKLSLQSLGGPITIFESAGNALNSGLISFLGFLAFLSIAIGIINLFPIPGLDGGHLFIQLIEFIIRRPIPDNLVMFLYRLGFIFIFLLFIQSLVNDVLRMY